MRKLVRAKWFNIAMWAAVAVIVAVASRVDAAQPSIILGWDQYAAPADFSHAALMQSELQADGTTWTAYHEIARPDVAVMTYTVGPLEDGTYRFQLLAVDTTGNSTAGNTVQQNINEPPPAIPGFRIVTTTVVEIKGGQVVAQSTSSRIDPTMFAVD